MTTATIDEYLIRNAPVEPRPVAPTVLAARVAMHAALDEMNKVDDSALEKPWPFIEGDADVRYGLYRQYEMLEDARAHVSTMLGAAHAAASPARPLVAEALAASWDLYGLIAALSEDDLDLDPANGEWTVRQTLAHIVSGQRAYGWGTTYWLTRRGAPADDFPTRIPADIVDQLPQEETEAVGSIADIIRRLEDIVDLSSGALGQLDAGSLAVRARWSGLPVDVRFRLLRWSSHIREHTVQVEKTLGFIGRPITEVERLVRLAAGAYGRLEAEVFMLPADAPELEQAQSAVARASEDVLGTAKSVAQSAG